MGNCQTIDAATLVIQHPCGRTDKLYWPITAAEIMKMNPGHYVALLITTTVYHPNSKTESHNHNTTNSAAAAAATASNTVRVTRVKLLRPADTLTLGHVYRLIGTQEVMKGVVAKKEAKMRKDGLEEAEGKEGKVKDAERAAKTPHFDRSNQVNRQERRRQRTMAAPNSGTARPRAWQPSLRSISEAGSCS
ncbi:hypothetical protein Nepgr_003145 [Nepenthes gracilis]|uniref:DUF4228 domain protein n=1 Tax=Nepenthes gracilis TaxID=150966 RepID=A0AAD3XDF1_NEPGR|nr:hypothetical protein Nepgr_003145 [Nepenthes gracilis]